MEFRPSYFPMISVPRPPPAPRPPRIHFVRTHSGAKVENGQVFVRFDTHSGRYDVAFKNGVRLTDIQGQVLLSNGQYRSTADYATHTIGKGDVQNVHDRFGDGLEVVVHHRREGWPELRTLFWVYARRPELFTRLDLIGHGSTVSTRSLVPLDSQTPIARAGRQSLFVPYDNDMYSRYSSDAWKAPNGSYELGALYGPGCLTVGSIDHDTWKSAVRFMQSGVRAIAGVADKATHDSQPPPVVSGPEVRSPRFVVGSYGGWREGLERYADLNAAVHPPLRWPSGVPFGWSSWSGHKEHVNAEDARAATDFIHDKLPEFRNDGTAFINLDSFWDNLKPAQIQAFVRYAHSLGLKTGIYYSPFVGWGRLTDRVDKTSNIYADIVLKGSDGKPLPKLDGGYPLDPTHPSELARIDRELKQFLDWGFDYVKLDFMTHGALEGRHYDPKVQTGTQAYNLAMRHIDAVLSRSAAAPSSEIENRQVFIDLSIAPLFPSGYGHARRVSCDVFANIGATEYLLNATTYGFWTNRRLYDFNDPDSACLYQPLGEKPVSPAESRSRFTASVITGGLMMSGDDFTKPAPLPAPRARVLSIFSNRALLNLARETPAFWPLRNDTGSKAADAFAWSDGKTGYIAVFNLGKSAVMRRIDVRQALPGFHGTSMWELWTGKRAALSPAGGLRIKLPPYDCAVYQLSR